MWKHTVEKSHFVVDICLWFKVEKDWQGFSSSFTFSLHCLFSLSRCHLPFYLDLKDLFNMHRSLKDAGQQKRHEKMGSRHSIWADSRQTSFSLEEIENLLYYWKKLIFCGYFLKAESIEVDIDLTFRALKRATIWRQKSWRTHCIQGGFGTCSSSESISFPVILIHVPYLIESKSSCLHGVEGSTWTHNSTKARFLLWLELFFWANRPCNSPSFTGWSNKHILYQRMGGGAHEEKIPMMKGITTRRGT